MTEPVREEVVSELVAAVRGATDDASAAAQRRVDDLMTIYAPTDAECDAAQHLLNGADRTAAPGRTAFDLTQRHLWALAAVNRVMDRCWLPNDKRTLGDWLKVMPAEIAQEVVGYLVWAGLCAPPGDGAVAISAPPPEEDP